MPALSLSVTSCCDCHLLLIECVDAIFLAQGFSAWTVSTCSDRSQPQQPRRSRQLRSLVWAFGSAFTVCGSEDIFEDRQNSCVKKKRSGRTTARIASPDINTRVSHLLRLGSRSCHRFGILTVGLEARAKEVAVSRCRQRPFHFLETVRLIWGSWAGVRRGSLHF